MEKKILYYQEPFKRGDSLILQLYWSSYNLFASPCRMLIEVFIRKDFGERYFRLPLAIGTFLILMYWQGTISPILDAVLTALKPATPPDYAAMSVLKDPEVQARLREIEAVSYIGWYIFAVVFLLVCIWHYWRQRRAPSTFDFAKYSFYSGRILPAFLNLKIRGKNLSRRTVECWLEPGIFYLAGILLILMGQKLGFLLEFSAIVYSVSYCRAYRAGDNFVMDKIDQMIVNAELAKTFLDDVPDSATRNYTFLGRKPADPEKRKLVLDMMTEDTDDAPLAK